MKRIALKLVLPLLILLVWELAASGSTRAPRPSRLPVADRFSTARAGATAWP